MAITAEDIKKLSPRMKAVLVLLACLLAGYFYYFFYLQAAMDKKQSLEGRLTGLQREVAANQKLAAQKDKYVQEVKNLQETFKHALAKLPNNKEIPGLFEAVSMAGRSSGVDFLLFEPVRIAPVKPPQTKGKAAPAKKKGTAAGTDTGVPMEDEKFYTEIPIRVKVSGSFPDTLAFFDKVSKLPRITNVEDLVIGDRASAQRGAKGGGTGIATTCTIKTYMFLDKEREQTEEEGDGQQEE